MKLSDVLPSRLRLSMMEERANKVLKKFNYKYPYQIDIEQVCDYYKIKIKPSPEPDLTYSVCTGFRKGFIFLPKTHDYVKFKELVGEEFGHLYLHTISQTQTTKCLLAQQERQAKNFSAYLYMPTKMLRDVIISYDQPVDITNLAEEFLVSEEFAYYRLSLIFPEKADAIARSKGGFGYIKWLTN
ncbi:ImmA/IrrE family metallo-endopeptidase [Brevibacillus formosus]|uniref:ImmA/IrrE family metallo-endopeptidase n=1 Tax=Brevibacillus formosus TaxID=54913 RepID=UPI001C6848D7|nr:ImmA/IrrE family metallo-endopeptidase [Brevibacillus formosus]MBW5468477.1 ImmA/IrrE family metallo-endopeptidase [Brevibacillus formosus]